MCGYDSKAKQFHHDVCVAMIEVIALNGCRQGHKGMK